MLTTARRRPGRASASAAPLTQRPPLPAVDDSELWFLIATYLANSPCRRAARELETEIKQLGLLGGDDTLETMRERHKCPANQLRRLLRRLLELEQSDAAGAGLSEELSLLTIVGVAERVTPRALPIAQLLRRRELLGRSPPMSSASASELQLGAERFGLRGVLEGHMSAAYCVVFDATGERVFTGADDCLVRAAPPTRGALPVSLAPRAALRSPFGRPDERRPPRARRSRCGARAAACCSARSAATAPR